MGKIITASILCLCASLAAQQPSPFIHIDQFGYQPDAEKVAVLTNPQLGFNAALSYTPSANLEIRHSNKHQVVWSGSPQQWNGGATHDLSGDQGWWLNFSALTTPGTYYLIDTANNQRSGDFVISEGVYSSLIADAGRAFFYNRCNYPKEAPYAEAGWVDATNNFDKPLQDTECSYVYDPENTALRRDLSGGWFDAGDYNKYVTFAQTAVHELLWAYTESTEAFTDNWNIPESGNNIPDILDELKWEIDWVRKMMNPDGSVIIKMGSISFAENISAPPSANTHRRYYGPTCTSASIAAASMLAHAAEVFQQIPAWSSYAASIESEAITAFNYWLNAKNNNALEYDCDDGTINAGDADRSDQEQKEIALTAAVHLFALTGQAQYNNYISSSLTEAEYIQNNWWGPYKNELVSALLYYTSLNNADSNTRNQIINSMTPMVTQDWNGFFGFNAADLYRAFMPEWSYHWGSNSIVSHYANLNRMMANYGIAGAAAEDFHRKAAAMLHYLHGVNPMGLVYLSGMEGRGAENGIQEIYHTWFNDGTIWDNNKLGPGPAPGFVCGGPNKDFSVGSIVPPAGQPAMKSYKDWNTGWPENSWEITEPAIYYQAAYIRNLAAQISNELPVPVVFIAPFRAQPRQNHILLEWFTATEVNADYFDIQQLKHNDRWESIGRVNARGNGHYQFVHQQPLQGLNTYRLRQIDFDGRSEYSNIATATYINRFADISVAPNPLQADGIVRLDQLPNVAGSQLHLYDSQGRKVKIIILQNRQASFDLSQLSSGWYFLELLLPQEGVVWQTKLFKP